MLISILAASLNKFRMRIELSSVKDGRIMMTIIPTPLSIEGDKETLGTLTRPISVTGTPEELDAELAKGEAGSLSSIFTTRRSLAQQIEDLAAAEKASLEASRKKAPAKQTSAAVKDIPKARPSALDLEMDEEEISATIEIARSDSNKTNDQDDGLSLY